MMKRIYLRILRKSPNLEKGILLHQKILTIEYAALSTIIVCLNFQVKIIVPIYIVDSNYATMQKVQSSE